MSYITQRAPERPRRNLEKIATRSKFFMVNGSTATFAIPCWYREQKPPIRAHGHSRPLHDHYGWPSPRHPDHICQHWDFATHVCSSGHTHVCGDGRRCGNHCKDYLDLARFFPIHLAEEGYESLEVMVRSAPDGLESSAWIDKDQDWVARIWFDANIQTALTDPVVIPFSVRAVLPATESKLKKTDIVALAKLIVLPAPCPEGEANGIS